MKFAFMKKLFAHPVLLSLLSLSVCAAGAGVGYATWAYTAVNVDPSANAYKNGTATAGAFNFAYDVAPEYNYDTTSTGSSEGGYFDSDGNKYTSSFVCENSNIIMGGKTRKKLTITTEYMPTGVAASDLPSFVFPTHVYRYSGSTYYGSTDTTDNKVFGLTDHASDAHTNPNSRIDIIPMSYVYIGKYSEAGLYGMTTVTFANVDNVGSTGNVTIADYAFYDDYALTYVNFLSNLSSIGNYAFSCASSTQYTMTSTIYATYPGNKATWASSVTLSSNWHSGRAVVVKCSDYYINYAANGTVTYSAVIA